MTISNENYITIQGFMVNELKLKGNELLVYAIVYGFSQLDNQEFKGSLQYLADWCNSTKQGIIKNIKSLIEKGLIEKIETTLNNVKFISYHTTKFNSIKQSLTGYSTEFKGIQQSLPNNINNNIDINNKENILKEKIKIVVDYLNEKANTHYQCKGATYEIIKARLNDNRSIDDCKHVIDVKCIQWLNTDMEKYLRPETLFNRTKFESYLNEKIKVSQYDSGNYDVSNGLEEL